MLLRTFLGQWIKIIISFCFWIFLKWISGTALPFQCQLTVVINTFEENFTYWKEFSTSDDKYLYISTTRLLSLYDVCDNIFFFLKSVIFLKINRLQTGLDTAFTTWTYMLFRWRILPLKFSCGVIVFLHVMKSNAWGCTCEFEYRTLE